MKSKNQNIIILVGSILTSIIVVGYLISPGDKVLPVINIPLLSEEECIIEDVIWNDVSKTCELHYVEFDNDADEITP